MHFSVDLDFSGLNLEGVRNFLELVPSNITWNPTVFCQTSSSLADCATGLVVRKQSCRLAVVDFLVEGPCVYSLGCPRIIHHL